MQVLSLGQRLDVGGVSASVSSWQGDIAEVLVYNDALTAADQAAVRTYLQDKWIIGNAVSAPFNVSASSGSPLTLWPAAGTLPDAGTGAVYHLTFTATGGTPPWTFAVTGGSLPWRD